MRRLVLIAMLLPLTAALGQSDIDDDTTALLERLFPDAASFTGKEGDPPHYSAWGPGVPGEDAELLGLAFWTTELDPLERGFDGPIKMIVGMDTQGVLTHIIVTDNREPYGYFSVDLPSFAEQFEHKSIRDRFRVGEDVDAISRATISVTSASRAIRNSARRIARAYLTPPSQ